MEIIGIGDRIAAPFKRAKRKWKKAKRKTKNTLTGTSRKRGSDRIRSTRKGHERVTLTPSMRRAMPGRQPEQKPRKAKPVRAEVRGQRSSTAKRTGQCSSCRGIYGLRKNGTVNAHDDLKTGRKCPGGGRPPGAGRKPAQQPQQRQVTPTPPAAPRVARSSRPRQNTGGRPNPSQLERDRDPRLKNACAACGHPFSRSRPSRLNSDGYRNHANGCGPVRSAPAGALGSVSRPASAKPSRQVPPETTVVSDSDKRRIVAQMCAAHADDELQPHEVVLAEDGQIWIDRRRRDSRNVPLPIGRWRAV